MIVYNCEQGSAQWHEARLGIPTASRISDIVTPTGKPTANAARRRYALELAIERITGRITQNYETPAMTRGKELEPVARVDYYLRTMRKVDQIGFVSDDNRICGCSPDGLIGDDGGLEIKCPMLPHYCEILATGQIDDAWLMQCHFCMYVTGREWWDFVMYTDEDPFRDHPFIRRIERDMMLCGKIHDAVRVFSGEVNDKVNAIKERMK